MTINNTWFKKESKLNVSKIGRDIVRHMTLGQIKDLHTAHGIDTKGMRLEQSTFLSTLEILEDNPHIIEFYNTFKGLYRHMSREELNQFYNN